MIKPRILKGFRDSLPLNESRRKDLIRTLEDSFRLSGFVPIDTPCLEYTEVLLGKGGGETDKQIYRFADNGKRDVSMRFDLTVPFARYIAQHRNELYLPFKRYHIDKVWRGENTQKGRYREFTQCDFDIVGSDALSSDFEILLTMYDSLKALGVERFQIQVSHRGIFNHFLKKRGLEEKTAEILRLVDKLPKIGPLACLEALNEVVDSTTAEEILRYIEKEDSDSATLEKMISLAGGESAETERLSELLKMLRTYENHFVLNPSITRGLDYYTGIVFETYLLDLPGIGSVCSGGRYNNLAGLYTKESIPGVGASVGLDRLIAALEELNTENTVIKGTQVLIMQLDEKLLIKYHGFAADLRKAGISCEVYPATKKMGHQFSYAEKKAIPFALICGESEAEKNVVNFKNLQTRESIEGISLEAFISKVTNNL